jgi:glutaconyl-CoA/methylmalonyl-CoA decarboxylase subunit gamma
MKLRVQIEAQMFEVEVGDLNARPIQVTVDGDTFEVFPEDAPEQAVEARPLVRSGSPSAAPNPPASAAARPAVAAPADKASALLAPIPGVILSLHVKEGDAVVFGQELLVLEAMKMKNMIRASRAGTVRAVRVAQGDQVRKDQVLLEYAD